MKTIVDLTLVTKAHNALVVQILTEALELREGVTEVDAEVEFVMEATVQRLKHY